MKIGYARCSRDDQKLDLQIDALKKAGCDEIFTDHGSGAKWDRQGLLDCLKRLQTGDTLVVWKLDRLGRSVPQILECAKQLNERGVDFIAVMDRLDTSSAMGRFTFTILAGLAALEREVTIERTLAGLDAARRRGVRLGPPLTYSVELQDEIKRLIAAGSSQREVAKIMNIPKSTVGRIALSMVAQPA